MKAVDLEFIKKTHIPHHSVVYDVIKSLNHIFTTEERYNSKSDTLISSTIFQVCNENCIVYLYIFCHIIE